MLQEHKTQKVQEIVCAWESKAKQSPEGKREGYRLLGQDFANQLDWNEEITRRNEEVSGGNEKLSGSLLACQG